MLILLVTACIVFNCVLPVFNKEYDDHDDDDDAEILSMQLLLSRCVYKLMQMKTVKPSVSAPSSGK